MNAETASVIAFVVNTVSAVVFALFARDAKKRRDAAIAAAQVERTRREAIEKHLDNERHEAMVSGIRAGATTMFRVVIHDMPESSTLTFLAPWGGVWVTSVKDLVNLGIEHVNQVEANAPVGFVPNPGGKQ